MDASLGTVPAIELVTVGQRKGLGIPGGGPKRYVLAVDRPRPPSSVGDEGELLDDAVDVGGPTWVDGPVDGDVLVQTSAHGTPHPATAGRPAPGVRVSTGMSRSAASHPGQSVVLYDLDDRCVHGGGIAA